MVMFLQCIGHSLGLAARKPCSNAAKLSFAVLDLSKLFDKLFPIRAKVLVFGSAMFQLTLDKNSCQQQMCRKF